MHIWHFWQCYCKLSMFDAVGLWMYALKLWEGVWWAHPHAYPCFLDPDGASAGLNPHHCPRGLALASHVCPFGGILPHLTQSWPDRPLGGCCEQKSRTNTSRQMNGYSLKCKNTKWHLTLMQMRHRKCAQTCTHLHETSVQRAATPYEIWFWTAAIWWRGRALDSVSGGTASNSRLSACVCVCSYVQMPHLLIMSTHSPRVRSEVVDIKCSYIAIHGVFLGLQRLSVWHERVTSDLVALERWCAVSHSWLIKHEKIENKRDVEKEI